MAIAPENRTDAWCFTTNDRNDPRIIELKKDAKAMTLERRGMGLMDKNERYVVDVKGRLGKNNPKKNTISKKQIRDGSVPLDVAAYFDVYLRTRKDHGKYDAPKMWSPPAPVKYDTETFKNSLNNSIESQIYIASLYMSEEEARKTILGVLIDITMDRAKKVIGL